MRTLPYNISQNLIGYGIFRNTHHYLQCKMQPSENIELTVSKKCDPLFSLMTVPFQLLYGSCGPECMNPVKNTGGLWPSLKDKVTTGPKFLGKKLQLKPAMSTHALALNDYQILTCWAVASLLFKVRLY